MTTAYQGMRSATWMAWLLALPLFLSSVGALSADPPVIGAEFNVASVSVQSPSAQKNPSIAAYPGGYFAVWGDGRATSSDVYGVFLDTNGQPVGADSILITRDSRGEPLSGAQLTPSVAFNGTNFLVVWNDTPSGVMYSTIRGARVSTAGEVLDVSGIAISTVDVNIQQIRPSVASNGVEWEAVWQKGGDYNSIKDIGAARITAAGTVMNRITASGASSDETRPDIAWNGVSGAGSNYLVVWEDGGQELTYDVYACRIDSAGAKVSGSTILISSTSGSSTARQVGDQGFPAVVGGSGGAWMVVWQDDREGGQYSDVYCARVSGGTLQDRGGIQVFDNVGYGTEFYCPIPDVAWDGSNYVVITRDSNQLRKVYGRLVGSNGVVSPTAQQYSSSGAGQSGLAAVGQYGGGSSIVAWDSAGTQPDIFGCRVSTAGIGGTIRLISLSVQDQLEAAAAFDGTHHVVVWADKRDGLYNIYAARLLPNGTLVNATGVRLAPSSYNQRSPAISYNSTNSTFLVVWSEVSSEPDIKGMIIRPDLTAVSSELTICSRDFNQETPAVAWNGAHWLVVWRDARYPLGDGTLQYDIFGARVTTAGALAGEVSICTSANDQTEPCVCAGPSGKWLVAWRDARSYPLEIYCRPVTSTGTLQAEQKVSTAVSNKAQPAIACDGEVFFTTWVDAGTSYSVKAARLNSTGTRYVPGEPDITITSGATFQSDPSVVWNTEKYVVAWQDDRSMFTKGSDIYLSRVGADGVVEDSGGVVVSSNAATEFAPLLSSSSTAYCTAIYGNLTSSINRLRGRVCLVGTPPPLEVRIDEARQQPDNTNVSITGAVVTAGNDQLSGRFYIEDRSRLAGMKVVWSSTGIQEGNVVHVIGKVETVNGERQITATSVDVTSTSGTVPGPITMWCSSMGGVAAGLAPGVTGGMGPNNVGLLVKICGRVRSPGGGVFYIEDNSRRADGSPVLQKVICSSDLPIADLFYSVTGISSVEQSGENAIAVVLVRKASDVVKLQEATAASVSDTRIYPDGLEVSVTDAVVTAGNDQLPGCFYIEDPQTMTGIRVSWAGTTVQEGKRVNVSGILRTPSCERELQGTSVEVRAEPGVVPNAVGFGVRSAGGVASGKSPGIEGSEGPLNLGLLVRVWGRVRSPADGYFHLEDGSKANAGGLARLKIKCPYDLPSEGDYCVVTGISSCEQGGSGSTALILPRKAADVATSEEPS